MKYVFMGSPPLAATILDLLCRELYAPSIVVTQVAKAFGRGQKIVPTAVEQYATSKGLRVLSTENVNTPETVAELKAAQPDLVLVAAFGQILKNDILALPKRYCLNVHASLLPKYRGAAPIQRSIWNGDEETGVTIQKMARKLDRGDVLLQKKTRILADETSGELMDRLAGLGGQALVEAVRLIESGKETFVPQDEALATYAGKIDKEDAVVSWEKPALEILHQMQALQPWPVAETKLEGARLKLFKGAVVDGKPGGAPGDIDTDHKTFLRVKCGDGHALSLTVIQPENRKKLEIKEFLTAYRGSFPHRRMT